MYWQLSLGEGRLCFTSASQSTTGMTVEILNEPALHPSHLSLPDVPGDDLNTPNRSGNGYKNVPVVDGWIGPQL